MAKQIGLIVEDESDVDVLAAIISKIVIDRSRYSIQRFVGHGCGKLRNKCGAWASQLRTRGCQMLIVMHDLDDARVNVLKEELASKIKDSGIKNRVIVIPVREIEAWLLSDEAAIRKAMNLVKPIKRITNPELIRDPKGRLSDLVYQASNKTKRYINRIHNGMIAKRSEINLLRRCASFEPLETFLKQQFKS
ncbi:MAG TPA: DUF4276 family protein [Tepidisphaeraceae bacterium]|jgi:hypothetical protein|nr:DUF4276 family protein [Tepidisphaeraceae bacterium]